MKLLFPLLIFILSLLYIGGLKISLSPFKVELPNWISSLGYLLVVSGLLCLYVTHYKEGYIKGYQEAREDVKRSQQI